MNLMKDPARGASVKQLGNPQNPLEPLERTFVREFEHADLPATEADWVPPVDILADRKEYLFKADLPELDRKHVRVLIERDILFICGERKSQQRSDKMHLRLERPRGYFVRRFSLPDDASRSKVKAGFKNGVLEVHVRKARVDTIEKDCSPRIIVKISQ